MAVPLLREEPLNTKELSGFNQLKEFKDPQDRNRPRNMFRYS